MKGFKKKLKTVLRRGTALGLSLTLTLGLIPLPPFNNSGGLGSGTVKKAEAALHAPSPEYKYYCTSCGQFLKESGTHQYTERCTGIYRDEPVYCTGHFVWYSEGVTACSVCSAMGGASDYGRSCGAFRWYDCRCDKSGHKAVLASNGERCTQVFYSTC